jgi:glycosyltransferase involved in cell wall biosynthesis
MGIRVARGKYVAFVDADDWIESDMMQTLYLMAEKYNAHIASSATVKEYSDGSQSLMLNPYVGDGILTQRKRRYLLFRYVSNFTTMIFDREWLLQYDLCFPNARSCEDSSFVGQCYLVAERIAQINKPFYHYIIYPQSISHRVGVFRGKDKHKAIFAMFKFAKKHNLYSSYWWVLWLVYLKKVVVLSIIDYIKNKRN